MDKIKDYKDFGSTYDPGVTLYRIEVQGWDSPVLVEVRDCKYLHNLRPPFGVVAVHGIVTLPKEIREELEDKVLSHLGLEWAREQRYKKSVVDAAVDLKHKRIGFGEFKEKVRAYEEK